MGDVRQAAEQYRRMADNFPDAQEAEEALILSARACLAAGEYATCREQLNELRRRYIHPTYLDAMGQVEAALGRGYLEGKGEGGTYAPASRLRKARAIFQHILDEDPQGRWADDALLGLGQCDEGIGRYDDALERYKELLEKYPASELRAEAEGRVAFCISRREPRPEYTESETLEALRRIEHARDEARAGDMDLDAVALNENEKLLRARLAEKRFDQAQFYVKNGHYRAAEVYYELIKARYPETTWAKKADEALLQMRSR
jgi:outer membrane protein assembly factor BamD (BamD/ComL family)